jgi:chromosome segregation ATPase
MTATIEDLERRVTALETAQNDTTQTLRWVVTRLGKMSAVQDEHTLRLDRIDSRLDRVEADLKGLRADLPAMLTEAVREGLKRLSD